jgi:hypothetical protein
MPFHIVADGTVFCGVSSAHTGSLTAPPGHRSALVAQGIERRPPEPDAQVRILPRALARHAILPPWGNHQ